MKRLLIYSLLLFGNIVFAQEIDLMDLPEVEEYIVVRTNPDADTILLTWHGGPYSGLYEEAFYELEKEENFSVVAVRKYEMDHEVLNDSLLTRDEAVLVNDTTVALLHKVVKYYKEEDKVVVLVGHSWGAILLAEYIDDYTSDHVDYIVAMEGRLNMPLEFVEYLEQGWVPTFLDGITMALDYPQYSQKHGWRTLVAAAFENRWIDSLASLDLENLLYTHVSNDYNAGALLPEEIDFLEDVGATSLFIDGGFHGISLNSEYQAEVVKFIRGDFFSTTKEAHSKEMKAKVFPSLASEYINLETKEEGFYQVFDLYGRSFMKAQKLSGVDQIDIIDLPSSFYTIIFQSGNGNRATLKFQKII